MALPTTINYILLIEYTLYPGTIFVSFLVSRLRSKFEVVYPHTYRAQIPKNCKKYNPSIILLVLELIGPEA